MYTPEVVKTRPVKHSYATLSEGEARWLVTLDRDNALAAARLFLIRHPDWTPHRRLLSQGTAAFGCRSPVHTFGHLINGCDGSWWVIPAQLAGPVDVDYEQIEFLIRLSAAEADEMFAGLYGPDYEGDRSG